MNIIHVFPIAPALVSTSTLRTSSGLMTPGLYMCTTIAVFPFYFTGGDKPTIQQLKGFKYLSGDPISTLHTSSKLLTSGLHMCTKIIHL